MSNMQSSAKSNFGFRGWLIVLYVFLPLMIITCNENSLKNLASLEIAAKFAGNQLFMIGLFSYAAASTALLVPFVSSLLRRFSPKKVSFCLGILYTIVVALYGYIDSLAFWVVELTLGSWISVLWSQQVNYTFINNWFPKKRAVAMGWATIGFCAGSILGTKVYSALSAVVGMRNTYFIFAGICLLITIFGAIVVADYPEQIGINPDNDSSMTREMANKMLAEGKALEARSCWTLKRLFSVKETWFIAVSCGILIMYNSGFMACMVPRLTAAGYSPAFAVNMMMLTGCFGAVGSYACGLLDAKGGTKRAIFITLLLAISACILNVIPNTICVMISLAFIGMSMGGSSNYLVSITIAYWGRYHYSRAFRAIMIVAQFINPFGALLVTTIAQSRGFNTSYIVMAVIGLIGLFLISLVKEDAIGKYTEKFTAEDEKMAKTV